MHIQQRQDRREGRANAIVQRRIPQVGELLQDVFSHQVITKHFTSNTVGNCGADDYLSKPFHPNELKARVSAVLCRHGLQKSSTHEVQSFNDLTFDDAELTVTRSGKPITLTEREYRLASCLFANLTRPLSREYLYERFWTHEEIVSSRPLDTHIYRLRNKLGLTADRDWQLLTIYGYGYRSESVTPA